MSATDSTARTWELDQDHSSVIFGVGHNAGIYRASFKKIAATIEMEGDELTKIEGSVEVASLDTAKSHGFYDHMMAEDFFHAEAHPQLRFASAAVRHRGDGTFELDGELTMKGIARPVSATGIVERATTAWGEAIGLAITATIDRSEFEILYDDRLPSGELSVPNEVELMIDLCFTASTGDYGASEDQEA